MKINNPGAYYGCILVEYRGSNLNLLNSKNAHYIKPIEIKKSLEIDNNKMEPACFKLEVYNKELLIVLDGCVIYEIIKKNNTNTYNLITESYINGFKTFKHSSQFIITTKLIYYNIISETDSRQESFNLTLILKNNKEVNNLFN